jgi:LacI family transcriptional regulator
MATIKDIARECGVSAVAVSSVLNNRTGQVSPKTRERILEAMRRMDYRPNAAARSMVGKGSKTIGISDQFSPNDRYDSYKAHLLQPITHAARALQWHVLYYSGHNVNGMPSHLDGRCEGLICFTGTYAHSELESIVRSNIPVVFIGDTHISPSENNGAVIDIDNKAGAYLAVLHLAKLGHKRIVMIEGAGISGNKDRIAGFKDAMIESGLGFDNSMIYSQSEYENSGYVQAIAFLTTPISERPTAVFCFNDGQAIEVLKAAAECGIRVPEDLSIVGFDDIEQASRTVPPLTTIHQPLEWIGARSVQILHGIIEGSIPRNYREIVPPELVIRHSTGPFIVT